MERAIEVGGHDGPPSFIGHADEQAVIGEARVVDQYGDRSESLFDLGDRVVDAGRVTDIDGDSGRAAAGPLDVSDDPFRLFRARAVADRDGMPGGSQSSCGRRADATRSTGHEGHTSRRLLRGHVPHRRYKLAHAMPAPIPAMSTRLPSMRRPSSSASASAIGTEAADVFP